MTPKQPLRNETEKGVSESNQTQTHQFLVNFETNQKLNQLKSPISLESNNKQNKSRTINHSKTLTIIPQFFLIFLTQEKIIKVEVCFHYN